MDDKKLDKAQELSKELRSVRSKIQMLKHLQKNPHFKVLISAKGVEATTLALDHYVAEIEVHESDVKIKLRDEMLSILIAREKQLAEEYKNL